MTIYEEIKKDKNVYVKDRPLLSLIMGEICVDGKPMADKDVIKRLSQMKKATEKNIEIYDKSAMVLQANSERKFSMLLDRYLPVGPSKMDIDIAIAYLEVDQHMKSMGVVMKHLKDKFDVVDGNLVKQVLMGG